jgi:hypothetical protein
MGFGVHYPYRPIGKLFILYLALQYFAKLSGKITIFNYLLSAIAVTYSTPNFFMNLICICCYCQVLKFRNIFKVFIGFVVANFDLVLSFYIISIICIYV